MYIAFSVSAYSRGAQTLGKLGRWCVTMGAIEMSSQLHVVGTYVYMYMCRCANVLILQHASICDFDGQNSSFILFTLPLPFPLPGAYLGHILGGSQQHAETVIGLFMDARVSTPGRGVWGHYVLRTVF